MPPLPVLENPQISKHILFGNVAVPGITRDLLLQDPRFLEIARPESRSLPLYSKDWVHSILVQAVDQFSHHEAASTPAKGPDVGVSSESPMKVSQISEQAVSCLYEGMLQYVYKILSKYLRSSQRESNSPYDFYMPFSHPLTVSMLLLSSLKGPGQDSFAIDSSIFANKRQFCLF